MSDLSKLLDDVYRSGSSTPAAPSWSSDSALDEVFSDWVPGEPEGATPAEQAFAEVAGPAPLEIPNETRNQLDALVQAAVAMAPEAEDEYELPQEMESVVDESTPVVNRDAILRWTPERAPEMAMPVEPLPTVTPWSRRDDDILPRRGLGGRRRRVSLRRK